MSVGSKIWKLLEVVTRDKYIIWATLSAMLLGVLLGYASPELMKSTAVIGKVFVGLLKMLVMPLVMVAVVSSILGLGTPQNLRNLGGKTFFWYTVSTLLAVFMAVIFAGNIDLTMGYAGTIKTDYVPTDAMKSMDFTKLVMSFIPANIFASLSTNAMAQVITFAIFFGIAALYLKKEQYNLIYSLSRAVNDVMIKIAGMIIRLTPLGVFSLIGQMVASQGIGVFESLWLYVLLVSGLLIGFVVVVHTALLIFFARVNPFEHYKVAKDQLIIAFSTASSVATIPTTLRCAEKLKVNAKVAGFSIPLGATVNMSGTGLYMVIAVLFIMQLAGIHLDWWQMISIALLTTVLTIGVSGTPGASLIGIVLILSIYNIPLEYISVILVVDRLLDQLRTAVNVHDDLVLARVLNRTYKEEALQA